MAWAIGMGLMKTFLVNYSRTMFYQISFVAQTTLKILGTNLSFPCPFPSFILNPFLFLIDVIKLFANVFEYGASISNRQVALSGLFLQLITEITRLLSDSPQLR